jgi:hypothetical protein
MAAEQRSPCLCIRNALRTCLQPAGAQQKSPAESSRSPRPAAAGAPTRDLREECLSAPTAGPRASACCDSRSLPRASTRSAHHSGFAARLGDAVQGGTTTDDETRPAARGVSKGLTKGGCR